MRDLPLKYKFWLVNIVAFVGMALLTLFAINRTHSAVLEAGKTVDFGTVFWSEAPAYAGVVFLLMLAVLAGSQALIVFVERHVDTLLQAMLKVQHQRDLGVRVASESRDEVGEMGRAFNAMQEALLTVIRQVEVASRDVRGAVDGMRDAAQHTRTGMQAQQQSAGQIEQRVREMLTGAQTVLQQATQAQSLSRQTQELAQTGSSVVRDLTAAFRALAADVQQSSVLITKLAEDSNRIGSVLNVIREIAEQTNLLALNAAIEAARAGESGRGFAVVADEVRKLARRAGESTEEIRNIVEALQQTTRSSVELMTVGAERANASQAQAERAAEALTAINDSVRSITDGNHAITQVTEQQASLAEQVYQDVNAIQHITDETRQTTLTFVQSSEQLTELAGRLQQTVGQFRF
ncbi:methyl-accepting chemotaxis protein [Permianibacter sp. IMCC34836]|uniref:methyl-accepting chemotaxis protein n=1 Tax=Permianibacter fluminis TaxID=2738515 RepID=UPI0015552BD0|nr:methyl-accepting chemotaxis protein [Permianibacter fluminis]NQD37674.1 methyl-accepting chemotaxis protein [Permianibacter fluminis]